MKYLYPGKRPYNGAIKYYKFRETGLAVHKINDEQGFCRDIRGSGVD